MKTLLTLVALVSMVGCDHSPDPCQTLARKLAECADTDQHAQEIIDYIPTCQAQLKGASQTQLMRIKANAETVANLSCQGVDTWIINQRVTQAFSDPKDGG